MNFCGTKMMSARKWRGVYKTARSWIYFNQHYPWMPSQGSKSTQNSHWGCAITIPGGDTSWGTGQLAALHLGRNIISVDNDQQMINHVKGLCHAAKISSNFVNCGTKQRMHRGAVHCLGKLVTSAKHLITLQIIAMLQEFTLGRPLSCWWYTCNGDQWLLWVY